VTERCTNEVLFLFWITDHRHTYKLTIRIREEEWPVIFLLIHLHVFIEAKPVGERDGEGNIKSMK